MIIKLLVDAGDMKPGPAVGQKLGPLGINMGKVVQDVNAATKQFKGVKVPVELNINKDKTFTVNVLSPPTTELLKKELGVEKASGFHKKIKAGNASIEQVISVAKTKHPNMLAKDFKSAVKTVVGSCISGEILIDSKDPREVIQEIDEGKYDKEISEQRTETDPEKRRQLDEFFSEIKAKQDALVKKETEEKEAEDAKKAAKAATAAPAAGADAKKESAKPAAKKK